MTNSLKRKMETIGDAMDSSCDSKGPNFDGLLWHKESVCKTFPECTQ